MTCWAWLCSLSVIFADPPWRVCARICTVLIAGTTARGCSVASLLTRQRPSGSLAGRVCRPSLRVTCWLLLCLRAAASQSRPRADFPREPPPPPVGDRPPWIHQGTELMCEQACCVSMHCHFLGTDTQNCDCWVIG